MNLKISKLRVTLLGSAFAMTFAAVPFYAQNAHSIPQPTANGPQSPFAGTVVEEPIVFVNDQIISKSDYDRQEQELENTAKQQNWTPEQLESQKKNLLRDLVDQQLLLSKGKMMGITGETEMVKQLDAIRKQNNLDSMDALEAAAKQQGVSFEDFKQHIRDRVVTQQVIGQEVYRKVNITQGDLQRFYEAHRAQFERPETVRLSEILVPIGSAAPSATGTPEAEDPAQVTAAQAKAQEAYAKLQGGAKFDEVAKATSSGTTAGQGGDLGEFKRGQLAKVLEDQTFNLKPGEYTQPIRTKQGYVILYVVAHNAGGVPPLKDVLPQVEEALGAERTEPALRAYLKQLRMEAYIDYKPGYVDTAAVINPSKPIYSAYAPPGPKKKRKIERTRYRQRTFGSGPKTQQASAPAAPPATSAPVQAAAPSANVPSLADVPGAATASNKPVADASSGQVGAGTKAEDQVGVSNPPAPASPSDSQTAAASATPADAPDTASQSSSSFRARSGKNTQMASTAALKPGKREKIRYGQAPTKTLPSTTATQTVDAGANGNSAASSDAARNGMAPETQVASNNGTDLPGAEEASAAVEKKSRFSDRAKLPKEKKSKEPKFDPFAPPPVNSQEVADRQVQSAPLGLAGDQSKEKKAKPTEKTRFQDKAKKEAAAPADGNASDTTAPASTPSAVPPAPATTAPAAETQPPPANTAPATTPQ